MVPFLEAMTPQAAPPDGISDESMRGAMRIIDAAVARGARLSIRQDIGTEQWPAILATGHGTEAFAIISRGSTELEAIWPMALRMLGSWAGRRFLTADQMLAAADPLFASVGVT